GEEEFLKRRSRAREPRERKRASNTTNLKAALRGSDEAESKYGNSKEMLLPLVVVVVLVVLGGGLFFMMDRVLGPSDANDQGEMPTTAAAPPGAPGAAVKDENSFATPDHYLELSLNPDGTCSYSESDKKMTLPYTKYELTPGGIIGQAFASLVEKQRWFVKTQDGMRTDQDVMLYPLNSNDWIVITRMKEMYEALQAYTKANGGYPTHAEELISMPAFDYTNPYTGKKTPVTIRGYVVNLQERLETDILLGDEGGVFKPGEIRVYAIREVSEGKMVGSMFFIRGADSHGRFFRVRSAIENKVLFFAGSHGKDISNYVTITERSTAVASKPTRIWLASEGQPPANLIHHILPIMLAVLSFLIGGRSLLVRDGEAIRSPVNRVLRITALVGLGLTIICMILQFGIFG
ncbi:MAG: hypothetical protein K2Z81_15765, partial [Cyanobacteria bacterium]|nr:hypothetical protein [Cyanobacteriota bacterium]